MSRRLNHVYFAGLYPQFRFRTLLHVLSKFYKFEDGFTHKLKLMTNEFHKGLSKRFNPTQITQLENRFQVEHIFVATDRGEKRPGSDLELDVRDHRFRVVDFKAGTELTASVTRLRNLFT